jgi:hypothetical protein
MNPRLEYLLFAILFLTQGYLLYKLEVIKMILAALTSISARLTSITEVQSQEIKKLKK